jgi:hypothetical protein
MFAVAVVLGQSELELGAKAVDLYKVSIPSITEACPQAHQRFVTSFGTQPTKGRLPALEASSVSDSMCSDDAYTPIAPRGTMECIQGDAL